VSFDPRGVGRSDGLHCFPTEDAENSFLGQAADGFPVGKEQTLAWDRIWHGFDAQCAEHGGAVLWHMSTADVARDMDLFRAALGERTLTYYGPSYGTVLGATYANMFPERVGSMVLDGNIDPVAWTHADGSTPTALRMAAYTGTATTMHDFLTLCGRAAVKQCAFSAGSPAATIAKYQTLLQRLRSHPVSAGSPPQSFTSATAVAAVRDFLYTTQPEPGLGQPGWAGGAQLLQELWQGSGRGVSARGGTVTPKPSGSSTPAGPYLGIEQLLGVACADSPNPSEMGAYAAQGDLAALRSGAFGPLWSWWSAVCAAWPAAGQSRYTGPWNRPTAHPILVVGNTADPATAYSGSVAMARDLARARLLTVSGDGHSALLNTSSCANRYIADYLLAGALPPSGAVCTQDTEPFTS
jgi:pimeloyl-ACP methyl ester carboxylesterase